MLDLDHLTVVAPSLAEGVGHVSACLGIDMPYGGAHPEMGTHNHVLRLGDDVFLEVIAVDDDAPAPSQPRWFGLDDRHAVRAAWESGRRLRGWVARTNPLDAVLARHGGLLGRKRRVSRGGRSWIFAVPPDGTLPADGVAPSVIDWEGGGTPAPAMPDLGARLLAFAVEHPDPGALADLYRLLEIRSGPEIACGAAFRYRATIETPAGRRDLY